MKNNGLRGVLLLAALVFAGAAEELFPPVANVGWPFLLAVVLCTAQVPNLLLVILLALGAGGMADALAALPPLTSGSYFLLAAAAVRWMKAPLLMTVLAAPLYFCWLGILFPGSEGNIFIRMLVALPLGAVAFLLVRFLLSVIERKAAFDVQG